MQHLEVQVLLEGRPIFKGGAYLVKKTKTRLLEQMGYRWNPIFWYFEFCFCISKFLNSIDSKVECWLQ